MDLFELIWSNDEIQFKFFRIVSGFYWIRLFSFTRCVLFSLVFFHLNKENSFRKIEHRCRCNPIFWIHWELLLPMAVNSQVNCTNTELYRCWIDIILWQKSYKKIENGNRNRNEFRHMWTNDFEFIWVLSFISLRWINRFDYD